MTDWLTADEASAYLKFPNVNAFYQWLRRNPDFPIGRRGGALLFDRNDCDAFVRGTLRHKRQIRMVSR